ncbi:MAG: DUF928 domain-containing protein [Hydrococcus sp. SU_1_0]|nr:DUF928 domain-containing protein [Hydrococcus sp. SU_1_0]
MFFSNFDQLAQSSQTNYGYVPPAKDQKQQEATASGSRGCPGKPVDITSLIPTSHTATTISAQPNFLFLVKSVPNLPVRFSLIEPRVTEPLWKSNITVNRAGILSVSIPPTVSLDVGKEYVWNLEVICNPSRPSENWYNRAVIKRVSLKPELAAKLDETNSETEKAVILANNGIWYDAIAISYHSRDEAKAHSYFQQLLAQIDILLPQPN